MRNLRSAILLLAISLIAAASVAQDNVKNSTPAAPSAAPQQAVPPTEISADLGTCTALINITDASSKPIFEAKVSARIRYGLMGAKKLDLEAYSSANGQVKILGLPEVPKKPVYFYVSKDEKLEIVEFRPDVHCRATFDVQLK